MVEKIKEIKDEFLKLMEQDVRQRGAENANIKFHGELADIVKDLAEAEKSCWEAEYYRTVIEAMDKGSSSSSGYTDARMGYSQMGGSSDIKSSGRRGYSTGSAANGGIMGHTDPVSAIRDIMATADGETRMRIRKEFGM